MKSGKIKISRFNEGLTVFKPHYYLNRGKKVISDLLDKGIENLSLADLTDKLYQGGIFKRVFVESEDFAHQYVTASDMVKTQPLDTAKNISIKYTPWVDEMTLRDKQILISCAGTVGNTALVNNSFSGCIGSQEIIRIETSKVPYGFLYAYLSSPIVNEYIQSMIYGAVVPRISPGELGRLPVLLPNEPKQQEIHKLIIETAELRVEANKLLKKAQEIIVDKIHFKPKNSRIAQKVSINTVFEAHHKRYEAQYYVSEGYEIKEHIKEKEFKYLSEVSKPVFRPGIFKRHYVDKGLEFLGGSDIVRAIPKSDKKLSIAKTTHLRSLKIEEDWILVTCGGTIGFSVLVNRYLANKTASQHILRVIADDIKSGYLFAFMSSSLGLKAIQSFTYGSVIPQIEPHHLELLPIPILEEELMDEIHNMVMKYKENISTAIENELEAINLIENEMEQWQTS